jgi:hypothetical protein
MINMVQAKIGAQVQPTATYQAPTMDFDEEAQKKDYAYSLCESIDYQQPVVEAPVPAMEQQEQTITLTKEQFDSLMMVAPQLSALGVASKQNDME